MYCFSTCQKMYSDIISVIIPTRNRAEKLVNAVRNVNKQNQSMLRLL